jgi:dimeric dUTPase (all-alpha-NTP-PPase superfamily)
MPVIEEPVNEEPFIDDANVTIHTDVSGIDDVAECNSASVFKSWIKLVSIDASVLFDEYTRRSSFAHVASICMDNEIKAATLQKKRNTLIRFVAKISSVKFAEKAEWLYIITINGRIVKLGGTRTGLKNRAASYLCGHHTRDRGKSGDCSKTNAFVYNTVLFYLSLGCHVEMYGYKLPIANHSIDIFGETENVSVQTYHVYESKFLEDIRTRYFAYPVLNDNCDPVYRAN